MALVPQDVASRRAARRTACTRAVAKFSDTGIMTMEDARKGVDAYKRIEVKKNGEVNNCRRDLSTAKRDCLVFKAEVDNIRSLCSRDRMVAVKGALRRRSAILYKFSLFILVLALLSIALYYSPDPMPLSIVIVIVVVVFAPVVLSTSPNPDYRPLNDLIDQLKRNLERAKECLTESEESCNKLIQHSGVEAGDCKNLAIQARTDKSLVTFRAIGATVKTVGNVVEASMNFFTSGFAGIMAAIVASIGVVAVAGAETYPITSDLADSGKAFNKLHESFDSTTDAALKLEEEMSVVCAQLKNLSGLIYDVEYGRDHCQDIESVCYALDLLLEKSEAIRLSGDSKG